MKKILIFLIGILFITLVSAGEISKISDQTNSSITIKSGETELINLTLLTPHNNFVIYGKDRKVAVYEMDPVIPIKVADFKQMNLYNTKTSLGFSRPSHFQYLKEIKYVSQPAFDEICNQTILKNGSKSEACELIEINKSIPYEIWENLDEIEQIDKKIKIALVTDVYKDEKIEWIQTLNFDYLSKKYSVDLTEWATWQESYNLDLKAYWKMDEASGTNAQDIHSSLFNGTITGMGVNNLTSLFGTSYSSKNDIDTDYISFPIGLWNNVTFNTTIAGWIYPSFWGDGDRILSIDDPDNYQEDVFIRWYDTTSTLWALGRNGATTHFSLRANCNPQLNTWNFIVLQWTNDLTGNATIWCNNTIANKDSSVAWSSSPSKLVNSYRIGKSQEANTQSIDGNFDEWAVWWRYLSPAELNELFNNGLGVTYSSGSDTEYPIFSNYQDNNGTLTVSGTGLFNVTVTSTNGTVWLEINNTNYTASNDSATLFNVSVNFNSNGTYPYKWHSWGNGSSNNYNVSNTQSYTILNDLTPPEITILSPLNQSYPNSLINFNISSNENLSKCILSLNDFNYTMTINSSKTGANYTNLTDDGNYLAKFFCNDTFGNLNISSVSFLVDSSPPTITLISPPNGHEDSDGIVNFAYSVSDLSNVSNCTLYLSSEEGDYSETKYDTQTFTIRNIIKSNQLNWYISCSDELGNSGNSVTNVLDTQVGTTNPVDVSGAGSGSGSEDSPTYIDKVLCNLTYNKTDSEIEKTIEEYFNLTGNYIGFDTTKKYIENWDNFCEIEEEEIVSEIPIDNSWVWWIIIIFTGITLSLLIVYNRMKFMVMLGFTKKNFQKEFKNYKDS